MTLPEQVRRQSEAVAKHYAEKDAKPDATDVATEGSKDTSQTPVAQADSVDNTAAESPAVEHKQENTKSDDTTMEQRYRTLQGMYNADVGNLRVENRQLKERLTSLEQLLSSVSASSTAPSQPATTKLVTDEDVKEYGDSLEVMRRVSKEELAAANQKIVELEQLVRQMQTSVIPRVEQVAYRQNVSTEQLFWSELKALVPDWQTINADTQWQAWLLEVDPLTGATRQHYLEEAQRNLDAARVANFFAAWKGEVGSSAAQSPREALASELGRQVSPGRSRSSGAPANDQPKRYSPQDIAKFYDDVRKGVYRDRQAERDRIERDIFRAQSEDRIVATG